MPDRDSCFLLFRLDRILFAAIPALAAAACAGCTLLVEGALGGSRTTSSCEGIDDGTPCERPGIAAPLVCVRGVCTNSRCGDGLLDPRPKPDGSVEECDDGNAVGGDGCEPTCQATTGCTMDSDCPEASEAPCLRPACVASRCELTRAPDGMPCPLGDGPMGLCSGGFCVPPGCGDGRLDRSSELCDDGNNSPGDGCSPTCKPECQNNEDCLQDVCLGAQQCVTSTAQNGGTLGRCTVSSSPLVCGPCQICDSIAGACRPDPAFDQDGDGYLSTSCEGGDDCNDGDPRIHPGRTEECGAGNMNCVEGDEPTSTDWFADCDGDGFPAPDAEMVSLCARPSGDPSSCPGGRWTSTRPVSRMVDCDDTNAAVRPNQTMFFDHGYGRGMTSFDYDCDGMQRPEYVRSMSPATASCGLLAMSCPRTAPVIGASAACGEMTDLWACNDMCLRVPRSYTVRCR